MGKIIKITLICPNCGHEKVIEAEKASGIFLKIKYKDAKKYCEVHCPKCKTLMVVKEGL